MARIDTGAGYTYRPVVRDYSGFQAVPPVDSVDALDASANAAPQTHDDLLEQLGYFADGFDSSGPTSAAQRQAAEYVSAEQAQALSALAARGARLFDDVFVDNMR